MTDLETGTLIGPMIAELRARANLSQAGLADRLNHITGKTLTRWDISRWENGRRIPIADLPALASALDAPLTLLEKAAERARVARSIQPSGPGVIPDLVKRTNRNSGAVTAVPLLGGTGSSGLGEPAQIVAEAQAVAASNTSVAVLSVVREEIAGVVRRYEELGPRPLITEVQALRRTLHSLLRGSQPPKQRRELCSLTGQVAGLLGYMAVNLGSPVVAEAYCNEASLMADFAEDIELQMWVGGTRSFNLYYQERYDEADSAAAAAVGLSPSSPQAIRLLINGRARALARMGAGYRSRAEEMIGTAIALSDRLDERLPKGISPCIAFTPYSPGRTLANAVTAYLSLGATEQVIKHASAIDNLVDDSGSRWTQALVRLDVATALLKNHSPDVAHAMALGQQALKMSRPTPIRSVWQRATELKVCAASFQRHGEVSQFGAELQAWMAEPLAQAVITGT